MAREQCALVAVVDVLSFSTTVSIAAERGMAVVPAAPAEAERVAALHTGARVASTSREGSDAQPWTLAPSRMLAAPVVPLVVLASPNGAAISASVSDLGATCVAASLRGVGAVARWLAAAAAASPSGAANIGVVAAGERWPGGALRPAVEDLVGAALLLRRLRDEHAMVLRGEAELTANAVASLTAREIAEVVRTSMSADELRDRGFADDVHLACAVDAAAGTIPVLTPSDDAYRPTETGA